MTARLAVIAALALALLGADAPNVATIDPAAPDLAAEWSAKLATLPGGGTLRVPDAALPYLVHTIWHGTDGVTVAGPGSTSKRAVLQGTAGVVPLVWMRPAAAWDRTSADLAVRGPDGAYLLTESFAADHRWDLYNFADRSLAPVPNYQWGVTTRTPTGGNRRPDHALWWIDAGPAIADGDHWLGIDALTFSFLIDGSFRGKYLCGLGDPAEPAPWYVAAGDDGLHVSLRCRGDTGLPRSFHFAVPRTPGRLLVTIQVGLASGRIKVWVNRKEVAVALENGTGGAGPDFKGGLSFEPNRTAPFTIGSWGYSLQGGDQAYVPDRGDVKLAAFCLHKRELYESDAAGNQRFAGNLAGLPTDDLHVLGGVDYGGSFLDKLDTQFTPPAAGPLGREVYVITGPARGHVREEGFFIPYSPDVTNPALGPVRAKGLTFAGTTAAAVLGQALDVRLDDCVFRGGDVGLSMLPGTSTYKVRLNECGAVGRNAGIKANSAILSLRDMQWFDVGRVGLSATGCTTTIDGWSAGSLFPPAGGPNEALIECLDGGFGSSLVARGLGNDAEGPPGLARGLVSIERSNTGLSRVVLDDISAGYLAPGVAAVNLADRYGAGHPGRATYRITNAVTPPGGPLVKAEGAWTSDGPAPAKAAGEAVR